MAYRTPLIASVLLRRPSSRIIRSIPRAAFFVAVHPIDEKRSTTVVQETLPLLGFHVIDLVRFEFYALEA